MHPATARIARIVAPVLPRPVAEQSVREAGGASLPPTGSDWATIELAMEASRTDDMPWHGPKMFKGGSCASPPSWQGTPCVRASATSRGLSLCNELALC